jgi:hypothetical protein
MDGDKYHFGFVENMHGIVKKQYNMSMWIQSFS